MINATLKQMYKDQIDSLFGTDKLSLPCKLRSKDNKKTQCPNCIVDPITGRSSGRYKVGGDYNFPYGQLCPVCNGIGFTFTVKEATVDLLIIYDAKKWINFNNTISIPDGMIQTISKFSDLQKIQSANTLIVDTSTDYYPNNEYTRDSNPQPIGLGSNDYLYTFWKGD